METILRDLAEWVAEVGFDAAQVQRWNQELATRGYPSLALWRNDEHHSIARALIVSEPGDRASIKRVQEAIDQHELADSDQALCARWLAK